MNTVRPAAHALGKARIRRRLALMMAGILALTALPQAIWAQETQYKVALNASGETVAPSKQQVREGRRLFNSACGECHAEGVTKTNQNVGLEPEALRGATPNRNNVAGLVDYLKNPTTYDGGMEIFELHPSTRSADIFTKMRNLTDADLTAIAMHILLQPQIPGVKWGGGKIYY